MGTTIDDWQAYRRAGDEGRLRVRIMAYAGGIDAMVAIGGPRPTPWLYDDRLRLNGVKLYLDGALGSRGAWLKAHYADEPGERACLLNDTQLLNLMSRAAMDEFQIAVHAIGDRANAQALDAIEELAKTYKGDRRWRIEHAQIIDPVDMRALCPARHHRLDAAGAPDLGPADGRGAAGAATGWPAPMPGAASLASGPLAFGSDTPGRIARSVRRPCRRDHARRMRTASRLVAGNRRKRVNRETALAGYTAAPPMPASPRTASAR